MKSTVIRNEDLLSLVEAALGGSEREVQSRILHIRDSYPALKVAIDYIFYMYDIKTDQTLPSTEGRVYESTRDGEHPPVRLRVLDGKDFGGE